MSGVRCGARCQNVRQGQGLSSRLAAGTSSAELKYRYNYYCHEDQHNNNCHQKGQNWTEAHLPHRVCSFSLKIQGQKAGEKRLARALYHGQWATATGKTHSTAGITLSLANATHNASLKASLMVHLLMQLCEQSIK